MSKTVQSVDRALTILEVLSKHSKGLGTTEIGELTDLHKSTVHRLLGTLIEKGFVEQDPTTSDYMLSLKLFEIGSKRVIAGDILSASRKYTGRLMTEVNEVVHVVVRDGTDIVYIDKVEADNTIRMASTIGRRSPLYSTSVGKAILAFMPEDKVAEIWNKSSIVPLTKNTIVDFVTFQQELNKIRLQGFSEDDEENEVGVRCVGAPVFGFNGEIQGAISISGPAFRITKKSVPKTGAILRKYADLISKELGYTGTNEGEIA